MSERIPPISKEDLPQPSQPSFDNITNIVQKMFGPPDQSPFIYKRPSDGALLGPMPLLLAAPEAGESFMSHFGAIASVPGLPSDAREVVILTVGARYQAAYELYSHVNVAQKKAGMSKEIVEAIARGEKPEGLNERCSAAFDAAEYLVGKPGPLPGEIWDRCVRELGKEGTIGLVHYAGAYAYTCIILNAIDAPVPEDGE